MRSAIFLLPLFLLLSLPFSGSGEPPDAASGKSFPVRISNRRPAQGEPVLVEVSPLPRADNVVMIWKGREIPMKEDGPGRFLGLIGIDLLEPPGKAVLSFRAMEAGTPLRFDT